MAAEAHLGRARIHYEWNELDTAEQYAQQCLQIIQQGESVDTFVSHAVFLVRLRLAQGDLEGAAASLDQADAFLHQHNFVFRLRDVAAARVLILLRQGNVADAAHLAQTHQLPVSRARVHLAQEDPEAALLALEPWRHEVEEKGWADKRLEVTLLRAVALQACGDRNTAVTVLLEALALAKPGGCVRSFVDDGTSMATLLSAAASRGRMGGYIAKLLPIVQGEATSGGPIVHPPIDALSQREIEVLRLIAQGLSNHDIGGRLFLALDTVKGHNRKIFGKLRVQRRTEAVARARELGLA